jgi:putative transposase
VTTVQDPASDAGLAGLVGREFVPDSKDNLWYGDITYIFTLTGWAYLATVIDGFSRKVAGWAVADNMREDLVISALKMAIANRDPTSTSSSAPTATGPCAAPPRRRNNNRC